MTIGQRIQKLRRQYSYSQEYVAECLGISRQAVSKWETDQTEPDTANLIALASLFHVTVEYLATGTNEKTNAQNNERFTKRMVGCILLGIGLVSMILGILFSETTGAVLFILSLYLLAGSTLCFLRIPYQGYLALALFWVITIFVLFVMMAHNPFTVFIRPLVLNISTIVDVLFWSGLIISILVASFRLLRKRKRK